MSKTLKNKVANLKNRGIGKNGFWTLRHQLDAFVRENFDTLYEGAVRINANISEDYYAPKRVQINGTRLHATAGLKIADGHHKYNDDNYPTEKQLRQTVSDLQALLDSAANVTKRKVKMKQYTFQEMTSRTSLLPFLAAETILEKANLSLEVYQDFIQSCNIRALAHYNNNEDFRKNLDSGRGRDTLYMFIPHWLEAYNKNPQQYLINVGYLIQIIRCGLCEGLHRVDYYGDCRNNQERFIDVMSAEKKLGNKVLEVFL